MTMLFEHCTLKVLGSVFNAPGLSHGIIRIYYNSIRKNENGLKAINMLFSLPLKNPTNGDYLDISVDNIFDLIEESDGLFGLFTYISTMNTEPLE